MLVCRTQMALLLSQDSQNTCAWEQHNCELGKGGSKKVNWALQQFFEKCFYQHLLLFSRKPECVNICHWGHPLGSRAAKSCVCAEENKQAERRGKRRSRHWDTPGVSPESSSEWVPAAVLHLLQPPGSTRCFRSQRDQNSSAQWPFWEGK